MRGSREVLLEKGAGAMPSMIRRVSLSNFQWLAQETSLVASSTPPEIQKVIKQLGALYQGYEEDRTSSACPRTSTKCLFEGWAEEGYRKLPINPPSAIGPLTFAIRDKAPQEAIVFSRRVIAYLR